jgi:hypothetical protein
VLAGMAGRGHLGFVLASAGSCDVLSGCVFGWELTQQLAAHVAKLNVRFITDMWKDVVGSNCKRSRLQVACLFSYTVYAPSLRAVTL